MVDVSQNLEACYRSIAIVKDSFLFREQDVDSVGRRDIDQHLSDSTHDSGTCEGLDVGANRVKMIRDLGLV